MPNSGSSFDALSPLPPQVTQVGYGIFQTPVAVSPNEFTVPTTYSLFVGSVAPAADVGVAGDWYQWIVAGSSGIIRIYQKTGPTTWALIATISGGTGGSGIITSVALPMTVVAGLLDINAATTSADGSMSAADKTKLDNATSSDTASTLVLRDVAGAAEFSSVQLTTGTITDAPLNPEDIPNKLYVDSIASGLIVHEPAVAATTGNVTLAGGAPSTVDGVALSATNRVLVKSQTDLTQNGIYKVDTVGSGANGTWTRTLDADTGGELTSGSYIFVAGGTVSANTAFVMTTPGTIVIGVSPINWTIFSQIVNINATSIIGQLVAAQIADGAINTAKFAAGLTPVEILGALPGSGNYDGRMVFLTTDKKLYRYSTTAGAFIASVAATDMTGQITSTQITDGAISTPKLAAGSVTTAVLAAGAVTAATIAANTITAGQILAGAIGTTELAANAVIASKIAAGTITTTQIAAGTILAINIAAGTITADKLNVATLSAITANLGTVTAGTITGVSVTTNVGAIAGFTLDTNRFYNSLISTQKMEIGSNGSAHLSLGDVSTFSGASSELTTNAFFLRRNGTGAVIAIMENSGSTGRIYVANSSGVQTVTLTGNTGDVAATSFTGTTATLSSATVSGTITGSIYTMGAGGGIVWTGGSGVTLDNSIANTMRVQGALLSQGLLSCNGNATIGVAPGSGVLTVNSSANWTWPVAGTGQQTEITGDGINCEDLYCSQSLAVPFGYVTALDVYAGTLHTGTYTNTPISNTGYITIKDSGGTDRRVMIG